MIDDNTAEQLARVFRALADPARVKLLSLIAGATDGEACVCDLIEPVHLSQPTVSHHMRQLVDAGLITREQRGKWAYYRVVSSTLASVSSALAPSPPARPASSMGTPDLTYWHARTPRRAKGCRPEDRKA